MEGPGTQTTQRFAIRRVCFIAGRNPLRPGLQGEAQVQRRQALTAVAGAIAISGSSLSGMSSEGETKPEQDHIQWVTEVLIKMQSIKPGMTRQDLYKVFRTEGGLVFSPYKRTFVSRDCPYFKVNVEFRAAAADPTKQQEEPQDERDDEKLIGGNPADVIANISTPYLQFSIMD
jgi:hypothetical protein